MSLIHKLTSLLFVSVSSLNAQTPKEIKQLFPRIPMDDSYTIIFDEVLHDSTYSLHKAKFYEGEGYQGKILRPDSNFIDCDSANFFTGTVQTIDPLGTPNPNKTQIVYDKFSGMTFQNIYYYHDLEQTQKAMHKLWNKINTLPNDTITFYEDRSNPLNWEEGYNMLFNSTILEYTALSLHIRRVVKDSTIVYWIICSYEMPKNLVPDMTIDINEHREVVYQIVEQMPTFAGGQDSLKKYLEREAELNSKSNCGSNRIFIEVVVTSTGKISNLNILRSTAGKLCNDIAENIIKQMPDWIPGKNNNGRNVSVKMILPITLK